MDLFDLYQHGRIRNAESRIRSEERQNQHRYRRSLDGLDDLHRRIDRLLLVNEAIWHLLLELTEVTEDDLLAKVAELDHVDGVADNRRQALPTDCACGAKINPKAATCMFCGAAPPPRSMFDGI